MKPIGRRILLATVLAVVVYAALALLSDVRHLRALMAEFAWSTFAGALALAFTNYLVRFVKWEYYLRRLQIGSHLRGEPYRPIPVLESFVIFLSGFVMSITPGKAGEVFKSALLLSARGVPIARSAPIVIADRLSDLLSLIVLVAIGSLAFPGYGWVAGAALGMVAAVLVFVMFEGLANGAIRLVGRLGGPLARLEPKLHEAYASLRQVTTPTALLLMTVVSLVAWGLECSALALILRGLGSPVRIEVAFFAYATATIAGAIAMLPGGLGGTEFTMRKILTDLGRESVTVSGAAVLIVRLATLWFAVVVGFVALAVFRRLYDRRAAVTPDAESVAAASPALMD